jgi:hypothetical protein
MIGILPNLLGLDLVYRWEFHFILAVFAIPSIPFGWLR